MKLFKVIGGAILMLFALSIQATTLKLSASIDLMVLDGHKMSGSLLKGADGLELERGEHQLLFRVEKKFTLPARPPVNWISVPQIVTFTTSSKSVSIQLPSLHTLHDSKVFDNKPQFTLTDEQGNEIASKRDLLLDQDANPEEAMWRYNQAKKTASVPRFARSLPPMTQPGEEPQNISQRRDSAKRLLHLWYQQVDAATRQRLVMLMNALHTG